MVRPFYDLGDEASTGAITTSMKAAWRVGVRRTRLLMSS